MIFYCHIICIILIEKEAKSMACTIVILQFQPGSGWPGSTLRHQKERAALRTDTQHFKLSSINGARWSLFRATAAGPLHSRRRVALPRGCGAYISTNDCFYEWQSGWLYYQFNLWFSLRQRSLRAHRRFQFVIACLCVLCVCVLVHF